MYKRQALNSFVTRDGLEMGRAQVVQAQAAGVEPDVRMNPILLKPSSDVGSQVIVNGEVRGDMPAKEYFRRKKSLIPDILRAYDSLADEFDIIVIEGAGSPAEINLKADDIVNMLSLIHIWLHRRHHGAHRAAGRRRNDGAAARCGALR